MNQDDARAFAMALNNIVGFVPPIMMQPLLTSPVAMVLQAVANGQMVLMPQSLASVQGEAGPAKPHLVKTDAEETKAAT